MGSQGNPEPLEARLRLLAALQLVLKTILRMQIDDHRQPSPQNHIERRIDGLQILLVQARRILLIEQKRRIKCKTNMSKADRYDQRDILKRHIRLKMRLIVGVRLGEPVTQVDTACKSCETSIAHAIASRLRR